MAAPLERSNIVSRTRPTPVRRVERVIEEEVDEQRSFAAGAVIADRFADEGRRRILLFRLDPADGPCTIELLRFEIETAGAAR